MSTLPWEPYEAWLRGIATAIGLLCLGYLAGARSMAALLLCGALLSSGCGPHDHPRQFSRQGHFSVPVGNLDLWLSDSLSETDRAWAEQAALAHEASLVGLQQIASNLVGVGAINGPRAQVFVRPGISADGSFGPNGPPFLLREGGWITVAAGEYATLPGLTVALARLYFPRDPTFDAIAQDTDDQLVRALRAQRAP